MKNFVLLSILFFSLNAVSQTKDDPALFCDESQQCTGRMREITLNYNLGQKEFSKETTVGYSGACYHISSMYDSNHEHHGAFFFERANEIFLATGIFSFFAESDPYQNMNAVELKDWFVKSNSRFSPTIENANEIELQYLGDTSDLHYWFRSHGKKLYVIAKQGMERYVGYIFCEMNQR